MSDVSPQPLLEVTDLVKYYGAVRAVDGVTFTIGRGETVALVGESGSGKTTIAKLVVRLVDPTGGSVSFAGSEVTRVSGRALRAWRRHAQIVFQNPYASLDPRLTVDRAIAEPLIAQDRRDEVADAVPRLLAMVGLAPGLARAYPHQLSGGQRQRVAIARALAPGPELLVLDEPVSALDVSVQAQVLNLLSELQSQLGVAYLLVSHDLAVVRHLAHRTAVLHLGRLVEVGPTDVVHDHPAHPYAQALAAAAPSVAAPRSAGRAAVAGDVPSGTDALGGCRFRSRCVLAQDVCAAEEPALVDRGAGHPVACHFSGVAAGGHG